MTSMRELFAVPRRAPKNFIALNVKNAHKKPAIATLKPQTVKVKILKEASKPNSRSSSKTSYCKPCPCQLEDKPKAYRNAGCQTIDLENNETFLEDGVIRYPTSKWKERSALDHHFKTIALQTDTKENNDTVSGAEINQIESEDNDVCSESNNRPFSKEAISSHCVRPKPTDMTNTYSIQKENQRYIGNAPVIQKNRCEPPCSKNIAENKPNNVSTQSRATTLHKRGVVPRYLIEKKLKKEREEKKKLEDCERTGVLDPDCPSGHILLPTEKRLDQLAFLKKNYTNLINELNRIPVSNDSLKVRQRRVLMEKELDKLEEGIQLFSKEKLFIKP